MALNLRKEQQGTQRIKKFIFMLCKKVACVCVFLVGIFFVFWVFYQYVPAFKDSADRVLHFILPFYERNGLLKTIGFVALVLGGMWAFIEEQQRKKKDA